LAAALLKWQKRQPFQLYIAAEFEVAQARNKACEVFLQTDCSHLVFIDDDVIPPDDALLRLLDCQVDIVGANVPIWRRASGIVPTAQIGDRFVTETQGLVEVDKIGTGFLCIHRRVIEALTPPWFAYTMISKTGTEILGEDYYFCKKAKEAGYKIYLLADCLCGHIKPLDIQEAARYIAAILAQEHRPKEGQNLGF
jgi:GT2 family glycosyltransferase